MKFIILISFILLVPLISACPQGNKIPDQVKAGSSPPEPAYISSTAREGTGRFLAAPDFFATLERISEVERSGAYFSGLGIIDSAVRKDAGDFSGSIIAAYKDFSWRYSYGEAGRSDVEEGITSLLLVSENPEDSLIQKTAQGVLDFFGGSWNSAADLLAGLAPQFEEPDSFYQWMMLVCSLETGTADTLARNTYRAIRARYAKFPEYWYRGARVFDNEQAAIYAEHCINLNPGGPFALECRAILADTLGLYSGGEDLRTTAEIEYCLEQAIAENKPEALAELFPLMGLPDNSYTHYAMGALKTLASVPEFREYFLDQAARQSGRLAERLAYIGRM